MTARTRATTAAAVAIQNMGRLKRDLRRSSRSDEYSEEAEPFSASGTNGAFAEGVKEPRGEAASDERFVKGVGGWSGTLSGAEGVVGMLSSGAGLGIREEGGEKGRDRHRQLPGAPLYLCHNARASSRNHPGMSQIAPGHADDRHGHGRGPHQLLGVQVLWLHVFGRGRRQLFNLRIIYNVVCSGGSYGNTSDSSPQRDLKQSVREKTKEEEEKERNTQV